MAFVKKIKKKSKVLCSLAMFAEKGKKSKSRSEQELKGEHF